MQNGMRVVLIIAGLLLLSGGQGCGSSEPVFFKASAIVEGTAVRVSAQTPGLLLNMPVEEGQEVARGQILAQIDTSRLAFQLEQIQAGLEEVAVQRQINLNTLAKAEADFENASNRRKRVTQLFQQQSAPRQKLDDVEAGFAAAKAQLQNVKQNLKIVRSKEKGLLAQEKLVRKQIADATVTAPTSGIAATKYFESGETVPPGAPVVEIIDLREMWTKVYVSEKLLSRLRIGAAAEVAVDGSSITIPGRIAWISPKAEFTPKNILTDESRTSLVYAVKVLLDNPDGVLKNGMPVVVTLAESE